MIPKHSVFAPHRAIVILAFLIGIALLGYTLSVFSPLIQGPTLIATSFTDTRSQGVTRIEGKTERVAFLEINGQSVSLSEDGSFSVHRAYPPGYTAVEIKARDRFGREAVNTFAFITGRTN